MEWVMWAIGGIAAFQAMSFWYLLGRMQKENATLWERMNIIADTSVRRVDIDIISKTLDTIAGELRENRGQISELSALVASLQGQMMFFMNNRQHSGAE